MVFRAEDGKIVNSFKDTWKNVRDSINRTPLSLNFNQEQFGQIITNFQNSGLAADAFAENVDHLDARLLAYFKTCSTNGQASMTGFRDYLKQTNKEIQNSTIKMRLLTIGAKALNIAFNTIATIGISLLINVAITKLNDLFHASERVKEAGQKASEEFDNLNQKLKDNSKLVEDSKDRFVELSKGIDAFTGKNISLSTDEYNEFLDISDKIAQAFPSLSRIYTDNGTAILSIASNANTAKEALDELIKKEQDSTFTDMNKQMPAIYKAYQEDISDNIEKQSKLSTQKSQAEQSEYSEYFLFSEPSSHKESLKQFGINPDNINSSLQDLPLIWVQGKMVYDGIDKYIPQIEESYRSQADALKEEQESLKNEFQNKLVNLLADDNDYTDIPEALKPIATQIVNQNQITSISNPSGDWNVLYSLYKQQYIDPLNNISIEMQDKIAGLTKLATEVPASELIGKVNEVQQGLKDEGSSVDISFLANNAQDTIVRASNRAEQLASVDKSQVRPLIDYLQSHKLDSVDGLENFLRITREATSIKEAIALMDEYFENLKKQGSAEFFTDKNKEKIDDFQDSLSKVNQYIQQFKTGVLTSSQVVDICQELGLDATKIDMSTGSFEGLEEELRRISEIQFKTILDSLRTMYTDGELTKETYESLCELFETINNQEIDNPTTFTSLSSGMSDLQSHYTTLKDAEEEYKNTSKLSYDMIQEMASAYPGLENEMMEYLSGLRSGKDIIDSYNDAYNADLQNYSNYYASKHQYDEDYYKDVLEKIPDNVKDKFKEYQCDLTNYSSMVKAKIAMEKELSIKIYTQKLKDNEFFLSNMMMNGVDLTNLYAHVKEAADKEAEELMNEVDKAATLTITLPEVTPKNSNDNTDKDDTENKIDWIDNSIENATNKIEAFKDKLEKELNFTAKIKLYTELETSEDDFISAKQQAADEYENAWTEASKTISESYKDKIMSDKEFTIEDFKGEKQQETYKKVTAAQEAYKTWQNALKELQQAEDQKKTDMAGKYTTEQEREDYNIQIKENQKKDVQNRIDESEAIGKTGTVEQYQQLKEYNKSLIEYNKNKKNLALDKIKTEGIKKGTDEYKSLSNEIQTAENNISSLNKEQIECNKNICAIPLNYYDKLNDKVGRTRDKISKLIDLMGNLNNYDKNGTITSIGVTKLGLYNQDILAAEKEIQNIDTEINKVTTNYANGDYGEDVDQYQKDMQSLIDKKMEYVSSINSDKQAIIQLITEGIDKETEAREKQVEASKKALSAEKDLYEYKKTITDKTKNIAILEKKIAALKLSTDRKDIAQRLKLEQELVDAKKDLTDTEKEHSYEVQDKALDDELKEYTDAQTDKKNALTSSLYAQEQAVKNSMETVKQNYSKVYPEIESIAKTYGITLSDAIVSPWQKSMESISLWEKAVSTALSGNKSLDKISASAGSNISSTLVKTTEKQTAETEINKLLIANDFKKLTWSQMAQLGKDLGVQGSTAEAVKTDTKLRKEIYNKLLAKFQAASFSKGGYPDLIKATGEDGIALVKRGEPILTQEQGKQFRELIANLPSLNSMVMNSFQPKYTVPNVLSQNVTLQITSPLVTISGITKDEINSETQRMINEIPNTLMKSLHQYGVK